MGENKQLVRTVPGTDLGGHDTAGVDGKERTERPGEILGTPNPDAATKREIKTGREIEAKRADYVTAEVDRANREDLPKLGGNSENTWEPDKSKTAAKAAVAPAARPAAPLTSAPATKPASSGLTVSPKVDKG